jgi:putative SOS response-associated peptidase YedK
MCGRYALKRLLHRASEVLGVSLVDLVKERFNISPTSNAPIIRRHAGGGMDLVEARWGLLPSWDTGPRKFTTINARVETVATRPTYRAAWRGGRRCLVPASGIYEWKATPEGKQPYFISAQDGRELLLAGLWESQWITGFERVSFTILVGPANKLVNPIHDRQAIMLSDEGARAWMRPGEIPSEGLMSYLVPCPSEELQAWPVSMAVNSSKAEGPGLIEPIGPTLLG